jgi:hypothetical protein
VQFDRGYLWPYFINNPEKQSAILDNPFVPFSTTRKSATSVTCSQRWNKSWSSIADHR